MKITKTHSIIRRQFAQTVFNHKIQEVAAERKESYESRIVVSQIVITAIVIAVLGAQALGYSDNLVNAIAVVLTLFELVTLIVQLQYGFGREARAHKAYAIKYLSLRDKYVVFLGDLMDGNLTNDQITAQRDHLLSVYEVLNDAPQTTLSDYIETQRRLGTTGAEGEEQETWSDVEIDNFLPSTLRIVKK